MPKVIITVSEIIYAKFHKEHRKDFSNRLGLAVAHYINEHHRKDIEVKNIEIHWNVPAVVFNAPDISVEIWVSTGKDFNPMKQQSQNIQACILDFVATDNHTLTILPEGKNVSVWLILLPGAVWGCRKV